MSPRTTISFLFFSLFAIIAIPALEDSFGYEFPTGFENKGDNPELKNKLILEQQRAQKVLNEYLTLLYGPYGGLE